MKSIYLSKYLYADLYCRLHCSTAVSFPPTESSLLPSRVQDTLDTWDYHYHYIRHHHHYNHHVPGCYARCRCVPGSSAVRLGWSKASPAPRSHPQPAGGLSHCLQQEEVRDSKKISKLILSGEIGFIHVSLEIPLLSLVRANWSLIWLSLAKMSKFEIGPSNVACSVNAQKTHRRQCWGPGCQQSPPRHPGSSTGQCSDM